MKLIDTVKIATAVGLLMQQTSVFSCPTVPHITSTVSQHDTAVHVNEAMETIDGLRTVLEEAYWKLLNADEQEMYAMIGILNPEKVDLCELQLRVLEATFKNAYSEIDEYGKSRIKPTLLLIAKARSAASNLNKLISQMVKTPVEFRSDTNLAALSALADHGTTAMYH
ncbi:hypothetical protein NXZ34_22345 [Escherichia coli]|nr:hypothetical protein [Escherichia coli]MDE7981016.1 hypothetical protein [Escherichia coli]